MFDGAGIRGTWLGGGDNTVTLGSSLEPSVRDMMFRRTKLGWLVNETWRVLHGLVVCWDPGWTNRDVQGLTFKRLPAGIGSAVAVQ